MTFINCVLETMEKKGITAYKLCKDLGFSQQTFSNWKTGKIPALDKAMAIIIYLGLSADEIFGIKKEEINISSDEICLLEAYRRASPSMKEPARKLLDVPEQERGSLIYNTGKEAI